MNSPKTTGLNIRYGVAMGAYWMSYALIFAFASVFLLSRGFDDGQIGVVMALGNVAAAFLQAPVASFADRTRKISLSGICFSAGMVILTAAILLFTVENSQSISGLLFLTAVTFVQLLQPLTNACGMFFVNRGCKLNFGLARGIGSLCYAIAAYVMGILIEKAGENAILAGLAAVYGIFMAAMLFLNTRKSSYPDMAGEKEGESKETWKEAKSSSLWEFARTYKRFMVMLVGVALLFANHNILNTYLYQIMQSIGGTSRDMGFSLSVAAVSELPTMILFSCLIKKYKCKSLIQVSAVFFTVKSVLFVMAGSVGMIHGAQLVQILAFALFTPASVYYVNQNIRERDHIKGQALSTTANTVGGVIGSLAGGQLLSLFGARQMLLAGAVLSAIGTVIVCVCAEDAPGQPEI